MCQTLIGLPYLFYISILDLLPTGSTWLKCQDFHIL